MESYKVLIIPYSIFLPDRALKCIQKFRLSGLRIVFIDGLPSQADGGEVIHLDEIGNFMIDAGYYDLLIEGFPLLRHYHSMDGDVHSIMFFNESVVETADAYIKSNLRGDYLIVDLLNGVIQRGSTEDGGFTVKLEPYQSVIYVFGSYDKEYISQFSIPKELGEIEEINSEYEIWLADKENIENFSFSCCTRNLFDIAAFHKKPDFCGAVKYIVKWDNFLNKTDCLLALDDNVGMAAVKVNDIDCGMAICAPYNFDIAKALKTGINKIEITVYTNLINAYINQKVFDVHPLRPLP